MPPAGKTTVPFSSLYSFIFGCAGSPLLHVDLSLVAATRGSSQVAVHGLLLLQSTDSRAEGFRSCGARH